MAARIAFAARAQRDLEEIADYLKTVNPAAVLPLVGKIERQIGMLERHPHLGPSAPETDQLDMRKLSITPYIAYYRLRGDVVEIARVLHGARDMTESLFE
ncbi:MAG: type II toxin-antitoxin system RelE/ParE family toxin [Rhizobiaceae bacterium]|nr:type II toxin-antitoxin system RelE/ParE family toxin [Rhizobiaceae bacterium]